MSFKESRIVKFQVMLARTKANLTQHKRCVDLRKCAFPGGVTTTKTGVKLFIFSQISGLVAMATQIEAFASLVDVSKDTHQGLLYSYKYWEILLSEGL